VAGLATRHAPSFRLISAHFALGMVGMLGFAGALAWRALAVEGHFFQPTLLGLTHLCVLGWLLPIALGALHQLVPVVFEVPVRSERLAWLAFGLYAPGALCFIAHLWMFDTGTLFIVSAAMLASAVVLYAVNLLLTLARAAHVTLTGAYVIAALGYLMLAASLGLALAWNLHRPFLYVDHVRILRAHAHAAGLGFFGLLVMGVAYRLLEMFLLSYVEAVGPGWLALGALNVALAALITNFVFGRVWPLTAVGVAAAALGIGAFLVQIRRLYRARTRKKTDAAWAHSLASFAYLALALATGGAIALAHLPAGLRTRLELGYGLIALPGFVGSIVVGQLYKIVPFLIWFHRFSAYVGLKKVPAASELLAARPQWAQLSLMHAGLVLLAAGVVLPSGGLRVAGALAFAASAVLHAGNLGVIYRRRP
jgi:hypothetical protein